MSATDTSARPLRADAERNRQRILDAARDVFASRGLDVSLDDIAAAAGVGVGTVYRRFPDKHALVDALFEERIDAVSGLAEHALGIEDPWEGFVHFFTGVCTLSASDRGFKEALFRHDKERERVARARGRIQPLASEVIRRAKESGALRDDLGDLDVPMLHVMIGHLADMTRDVEPEYWKRALQLLLDGLAADRGAPTPLPSRPLERAEFEAAMAAKHAR